MTRTSRPRSNKTPGRQTRHIARAQASRARSRARRALRDQPHVSRRSKAWRTQAEVRRNRRLRDARRFQQQGRAGVGQRKPAPLRKAPATPTRTRPKRKAPTARGPQRWPGPGDLPAYGPMLGAGKTRQARTHVKRGK